MKLRFWFSTKKIKFCIEISSLQSFLNYFFLKTLFSLMLNLSHFIIDITNENKCHNT